MVERWHPTSDSILLIAPHPNGLYVRYSDYTALEAENVRLHEKVETLRIREAGPFEDRMSAKTVLHYAPPRAEASAAVKADNGMELAIAFVRKRCDDYVAEHGMTDPETGTVEFPGNGDEYVSELEEIIEGLEALSPAPQEAEAVAWRTYCGGYTHTSRPEIAATWGDGAEPLYTHPPAPAVTEAMMERACSVHNVGWNLWGEPQKKTAREVMRAALQAAQEIKP